MPDQARARAVAIAAAGTGDWPDLAGLLEAQQATTVHAARTEILTQARTEVAGNLASTITDLSEVIVIEHLRPTFDKAVQGLVARLLGALQLPTGEGARPQRRVGVRGVYAIRGAVS